MTQLSRTSVVIGSYNGARYIEAQLESIARQTATPLEVIISDDRSTDATLDIAHGFAARVPFPVHVSQNVQNLGFSENFLQAGARAKGQFVAFCDQDDIWAPEKLSVCEAEFDADDQVVLTVHGARLIDRNGSPIGSFAQGPSETRTLPPLGYRPWDVFFGFSMVFRRSLLTGVDPGARCTDYVTGAPRLAHDRWILFLANLTGATREIALPLVDYRQHSENLFGSKIRHQTVARADILKESDRYLGATEQLLGIVDLISNSDLAQSTIFDREKALAFMGRSMRQQLHRNRLYNSKIPNQILMWLRNISDGTYRNVNDGSFNVLSTLKDLRYIMNF